MLVFSARGESIYVGQSELGCRVGAQLVYPREESAYTLVKVNWAARLEPNWSTLVYTNIGPKKK